VTEQGESDAILLADVGGTNVRFAVLGRAGLGPIAHMAVHDYDNFDDALAAFMALQPNSKAIHHAVFGVAGVVQDGCCALTNNAWLVDAGQLRARFGFAGSHIVNDFEAVAWSLPLLTAGDLLLISGSSPKPGAPMVVLGPGTGLGVAAYIPGKEGGIVARSEGGHTTMPSGSSYEDAISEQLRQKFDHVSAERVLSGNGLVNLYHAIASFKSMDVQKRDAAAITRAGIAGSCAVSRAALDAFCALLGEFAGDFALAFDAQGGLFIGGGIAPHLRDYLPRSPFRSRFNAKGRMSRYLEAIPAYLIRHEDPAFIGLRSLAMRRLWNS
jgi:glucokinase